MHRFLIQLACFVAITLSGQAATSLEGTCSAELKIGATGHKFKGGVTSDVFKVTFKEVNGQSLADFTVKASMANLTTFHVKRDREMHDHFKAEQNPDISGEVKAFPWASLSSASDKSPVEIPFTFSFGGGQAQHKASVSRFESKPDGTVAFDATFTASQKALGLKTIRMMAVMTVKDEVPVTAHFQLKPVTP